MRQKIDFLLQDEEDEIVPLEVKAETNVKAKSLRQFVADNQSKKAYRISMNDYQQEDWVTNVPLYAVNGLEIQRQHRLNYVKKGSQGGGIAFANIYEVPKNKNPQPAMGKLVGEIMIDFAFIRKYPIVNYKGYSSKAQSTVLK